MRRLELALELLSPACAQVFRMHRLEGMTQAQVAARLGISTTAVEKSMRRAFDRLNAALEGASEERRVANRHRG